MTKDLSEIPSVLSRHISFWRGKDTERPLAGVYFGDYLLQDIYRVAREGDRLLPEQLIPERFFDLLLQRCVALRHIDQDLIRPLEPLNSVPWLEGMLGCPIRVHAQSIWAEPLLGATESLNRLQPKWCDAWAEAALRFVCALIDEFFPQMPVAGPFLRGPADVIAAMIGTDRMCYELYDHPHEIHRLARLCAEAWIAVSHEILGSIPAWKGGYVLGGRWLYAPGPCTYSSEDITAVISPQAYREFFLPNNQRMTEGFSWGFLHRHSVSAHHLTALLGLPQGWAVELTMDPTGPSVAEILPALRQLQAGGRSLIVFGLNDESEVRRLVSGLSPRGLCVIVQADTEEQAASLLAAIKGE